MKALSKRVEKALFTQAVTIPPVVSTLLTAEELAAVSNGVGKGHGALDSAHITAAISSLGRLPKQ